jgi:hypothetical protein
MVVENEVWLPPGTVKKIAGVFGVSRQAVGQIWTDAKNNKKNPDVNAFTVPSKKHGYSLARQKWDPVELENEIKELSPKK